MHESVANHLSAAVSADGSQFLINPRAGIFRASAPATSCCWMPRFGDAGAPGSAGSDCLVPARPAACPSSGCALRHASALEIRHGPGLLAGQPHAPHRHEHDAFLRTRALDDAFDGMALSDSEGERVAR